MYATLPYLPYPNVYGAYKGKAPVWTALVPFWTGPIWRKGGGREGGRERGSEGAREAGQVP